MLDVGDDMGLAVSDGARVYVGHARADRSWVLTAIDGSQGTRLWSSALPISGSVINFQGLAALPGTVVVTGDSTITGYDASTGAGRWGSGDELENLASSRGRPCEIGPVSVE